MQPDHMLSLFTVGQLGLGVALVYTVVTGQWDLVWWVVIGGVLFTTVFSYWYLTARR